MTDIEQEVTVLEENVEIVMPNNFISERLTLAKKENRQLIVKLGFDPTAPDLHLGHAVVLKKLKQFQDFGHKVFVIIGDFTACIGDPTGKNKTRPPLTKEQVQLNAITYVDQLSKILDISKIEIKYNSEWLDKISLRDTIKLLSQMTVAQIMQRTDFNNRFQNNLPISLHELMYPLLQGQDSVAIKADIEMGGTDQLFNCTVGRLLQEQEGSLGQGVICMPLLKGIDGSAKMSKSENNYIGLTDNPNEMFGKIMSIPDSLLLDYINLVTNFSLRERKGLINRLQQNENPIIIKKIVAHNVVEQYHNIEAANNAQDYFANQFQSRNLEQKVYVEKNITDIGLESDSIVTIVELCKLLKPAESKSQIRRLIQSGAVTFNAEKVKDIDLKINLSGKFPIKIKIGKRDFFDITDAV
ncbi:tyrosine--tRNA ligase [Larkinella sp. VNQ87]|uniref:tyrosine--tRNA ligase n=1 Tax=Larkinella sp. VNQ87 TaxID=3400921 RepID=UPI003C10CD88